MIYEFYEEDETKNILNSNDCLCTDYAKLACLNDSDKHIEELENNLKKKIDILKEKCLKLNLRLKNSISLIDFRRIDIINRIRMESLASDEFLQFFSSYTKLNEMKSSVFNLIKEVHLFCNFWSQYLENNQGQLNEAKFNEIIFILNDLNIMLKKEKNIIFNFIENNQMLNTKHAEQLNQLIISTMAKCNQSNRERLDSSNLNLVLNGYIGYQSHDDLLNNHFDDDEDNDDDSVWLNIVQFCYFFLIFLIFFFFLIFFVFEFI